MSWVNERGQVCAESTPLGRRRGEARAGPGLDASEIRKLELPGVECMDVPRSIPCRKVTRPAVGSRQEASTESLHARIGSGTAFLVPVRRFGAGFATRPVPAVSMQPTCGSTSGHLGRHAPDTRPALAGARAGTRARRAGRPPGRAATDGQRRARATLPSGPLVPKAARGKAQPRGRPVSFERRERRPSRRMG